MADRTGIRARGLLVWTLATAPFVAPLGAPGPASPSAQEQAGEAALDEARARYVEDLLALADWCHGKKLFVERDRLWEQVLTLAPDDSRARGGLGYRRGKDGWERGTENRSRNFGKEHLGELAEREHDVGARYCVRLLDAAAELAPDSEAHRALEDEILRVDPDNGTVRRARDHVKVGDVWMLRESAVAKGRRAEIKAAARAGRDEAPTPRDVPPNEKERAIGLPWTAVLATDMVRALGTGSRDEIQRAATALHSAHHVFTTLLGSEARYGRDCTAFLLRPQDQATFLANHPAIAPRYAERLAAMDGSGIEGTSDFAYWAADEARRLDGIVRNGIGWLFADGFHVSLYQPWLFEGVGLYLTREIVGTRLSWFVQPSEFLSRDEEMALRANLLNPESNWMNEAHKVLAGPNAPSLATVFEKTAATMTPEDMLVSYALAAYLLEGRPEEAPLLMKRIGANVPAARAVQAVLGLATEELDRRLVTWLSERR
jgi:hypothetical protein